jgi:hypothetical protein
MKRKFLVTQINVCIFGLIARNTLVPVDVYKNYQIGHEMGQKHSKT